MGGLDLLYFCYWYGVVVDFYYYLVMCLFVVVVEIVIEYGVCGELV